MEIVTNWLDSHEYLGINAPTINRIRYRKVVTRSVLKIDDLVTVSPVRGGDTRTLINSSSVLACTDQYQIQNPNTNVATELPSTYKAYLQVLQIGLNNARLASVARLGHDSLMFSSVGGLSSEALTLAIQHTGLFPPGYRMISGILKLLDGSTLH